ncbi:MAG: hypothetical protein LBI70_00380 [Rickettsiales bacterium]|nr:hypothetical protein [Rickettsiales bacterium]
MKNLTEYFKRAFSLWEFTVVLAVIGVLSIALVKSGVTIDSFQTKRIATEINILDQALTQYKQKTKKNPSPEEGGLLALKDLLDSKKMHATVNEDGAVTSRYGFNTYWVLVDLNSLEWQKNKSSGKNSSGTTENKSTANRLPNLALLLTKRSRNGDYGLGFMTTRGFEKLNMKLNKLGPAGSGKRLLLVTNAKILQKNPHEIKDLGRVARGSGRENIKNLKKTRKKYNLVVRILPQGLSSRKTKS